MDDTSSMRTLERTSLWSWYHLFNIILNLVLNLVDCVAMLQYHLKLFPFIEYQHSCVYPMYQHYDILFDFYCLSEMGFKDWIISEIPVDKVSSWRSSQERWENVKGMVKPAHDSLSMWGLLLFNYKENCCLSHAYIASALNTGIVDYFRCWLNM